MSRYGYKAERKAALAARQRRLQARASRNRRRYLTRYLRKLETVKARVKFMARVYLERPTPYRASWRVWVNDNIA